MGLSYSSESETVPCFKNVTREIPYYTSRDVNKILIISNTTG